MINYKAYFTVLILILCTQCESKGQKPIIKEHPLNAYGLSLQRIKLRCLAEGDPTPHYVWYKSGKIVENYKDKPVTSNRIASENELFFFHLDTQDEDVYYCNASNVHGWAISNNASVRIAFLNKDIIGPDQKTASVGETVLMECKPPKGIPKPSIIWKFNGNAIELNKRVKVLDTGDLRIDKANRKDSGRYNCMAKNFAFERESASAMLTVRQKPYFKIAPSNIEVKVNEAAIFPCVVEGDPKPTINWRRDNNKQIPSSRAVLMENNGMRINKVQLTDIGNYICQATNSAGTIEAYAKLNVVSPPGFIETPENQKANIGDNLRFVCRVTGSPKPAVIWVHNGDHFIANDEDMVVESGSPSTVVGVANSRIKVAKDGTLSINPVKISDSGKYECKASSYMGKVQSSAFLEVVDDFSQRHLPPVIEFGPQNQTLTTGLSAIFNCIPQRSKKDDDFNEEQSVTNNNDLENTAVHVTWLRNGQKLNAISDPRIIQLTSGKLRINLLHLGDAGNYTCRVDRNNGAAYTMWTVQLRILPGDKNEFHNAIQQTTNDIRMFPSPVTNFEVLERGDSWITFKWDAPLSSSFKFSSSSSLTSSSSITKDEDSNNNGSNGGGAISYYLIEYSPYESRQGWYMQSIMTSSPGKVMNLHPNTGYRFLIRSVNDMGIGSPTVIPFVVFTTKKPTTSIANYDYNELKSKIDNVICDSLRMKSVSTDQLTIVWNVHGPVQAMKLLSGFMSKFKKVPLGRCLANNLNHNNHNKASSSGATGAGTVVNNVFMEHCSLSGSSLHQIEIDILNDPKSIFNEEGLDQMKLVSPIGTSGWNDHSVAAYTIISNLEPFSCYEVYVQSFVDYPKFGRMTGVASKPITILTYDSVPTMAPTDLTARWLSNTSVEIKWKPAPKRHVNGILKGYSIHIIGNDTNSTKSIEVDPKRTSIQVQDLILNMPYVVHIAAVTCQGEGIRSAGLLLTASSSIITMSPILIDKRFFDDARREKSIPGSITKEPWFITIVIVGTCLWFMICGFILVVCRNMYLRGLIYKSGYSNGTKLITSSGIPRSCNSRVAAAPTDHQTGSIVYSNCNSNHSHNTNNANSNGGNGGAVCRESIILQPLIAPTGQVTNSNGGSSSNDYKSNCNTTSTGVGAVDTVTTNSSLIVSPIVPRNGQRKFQDSISGSSGTCSSPSSNNNTQPEKQMQRFMNIPSHNVEPYASASLLHQVIGNSVMNNFISPVTFPGHRNNLIQFSDSNMLDTSSSSQNNSTIWPINPTMVDGINVSSNNVEPYASASLLHQVIGNNAMNNFTSHVGFPGHRNNVVQFSDSNILNKNPNFQTNSTDWTQNYADYSCVPFNINSVGRPTESISISSNFASPHETLISHIPQEDPFSIGFPCSNANAILANTTMGYNSLDMNSTMTGLTWNENSFNGNGNSLGGSAGGSSSTNSSSAMLESVTSSRDYNKYDSIMTTTRSGYKEESTQSLLEEEEEEEEKENEVNQEKERGHTKSRDDSGNIEENEIQDVEECYVTTPPMRIDNVNDKGGEMMQQRGREREWQNLPMKFLSQTSQQFPSQSTCSDEDDNTYDTCDTATINREAGGSHQCFSGVRNLGAFYPLMMKQSKDLFPPPPQAPLPNPSFYDKSSNNNQKPSNCYENSLITRSVSGPRSGPQNIQQLPQRHRSQYRPNT